MLDTKTLMSPPMARLDARAPVVGQVPTVRRLFPSHALESDKVCVLPKRSGSPRVSVASSGGAAPERTGVTLTPLDIEIEVGITAVAATRARFHSWLEAQDGDAEVLEDMSVVVSELTSNAVRASPKHDKPTLRAWVEGDDVVVRVENRLTMHTPVQFGGALDDPLRDSGRGLLLVRALTDETDVAHNVRAGSVVVVCRRTRRSPRQ